MADAQRAGHGLAGSEGAAEVADGVLRLALLGGVEIARDAAPVRGALSAKARALLCYLVVTGRAHSRGALAALLWGEQPEEGARANLRQALTSLRRAAGDHLLIARETVGFDRAAPYRLDVERFEQHLRAAAAGGGAAHLRAAVDLYAGDLLDGLAVRDAPTFEEWLTVERERLRLLAVQALHELGVYHSDRAEYLAAGEALGRLLALDPWREDAHRQLMLVLARSGQRDAALAQYAACRRVLAAELGAEPDAATSALYERIRAGALDHRDAAALALARPPAERRQLTLLDAALGGAATLAEQLDAEDVHELLRAWHGACAAIADRFAGRVVHRRADGVLLAFGYPPAFDDSAVRAVHAGLALLATPRELAAPRAHGAGPALAVRAAVHAGELVVGGGGQPGDADGAASPPLDLGGLPALTVGLLRARAEPGTVVLSDAAARLVAGYFDVRALGALRLAGLAQPIAAYAVIAPGAARGRIEARAAGGGVLAPLVGRAEESGILLELWARAEAGHSGAVLLAGDPGVGKSRLARVVEERAAARGRRLVARCSPHTAQSALAPIVELLRDLIGAAADDAPADTLGRLAAAAADGGAALGKATPRLAELLTPPPGPPATPPVVVPPGRQEPTFEAILALLRAVAARRPTLLLLEDLHWADPSTLAWLDHLLERPPAGLLVLLTARPEFRPPWPKRTRPTRVPLGPLPEADTRSLIAHIAGDRPLPATLQRQIIATADGIPLFVEELTRMVLEQGPPAEWGTTPAPTIPTTLRDTLAARLDRLGPAKAVAQVGAAIGREFPIALLAAAGPFAGPALGAALARLERADLILRLDGAGPATYAFKHALIRDAAYASLLKRERQGYHRRIAGWLEGHDPRAVAARPELLARHYTAAGRAAPAVAYWLRAGEQALRRAASVEAADHLTRGLALLGTLPDTRERAERELAMQLALGPALIATEGYGAPSVARAYGRARELAHRIGAAAQLFPALWGLGIQAQGRSGNQVTGAIIAELFATAREADEPALLLQAYHASWSSALFRGELAVARAHAAEGRILYAAGDYRSQAQVYGGHDPGVCALYHAAIATWLVGHADRAVGHMAEALALARRLDSPFSLGLALDHAGRLHQFLRDTPAVAAHADALVALAEEHGMVYLGGMGTFLHGWATAEGGQASAGLAAMRRGLATYRATGLVLVLPYLLCLLAEAEGRQGRGADALRLLDEAEALAEGNEERWWQAEIQRARGEVLAGREGAGQAAEAAFRRALDTARRQGALALELRAATSLGRFWGAGGNPRDARSLLDDVYRRFTEGFDTRDLREARTLLAALGDTATADRSETMSASSTTRGGRGIGWSRSPTSGNPS